jgi:hypothetical protein
MMEKSILDKSPSKASEGIVQPLSGESTTLPYFK